MTPYQKHAWYDLGVIALTLVTVLTLFPFIGPAAMGGFGWMGLLGFGYFFYRKKPGQLLTDERDNAIRQRAWFLGSLAFWLTFVLMASVAAPAVYGFSGAVPVTVVSSSVYVGLIVLDVVMSIATLIQYSQGYDDVKETAG